MFRKGARELFFQELVMLGIDVSKETLSYALVDPETGKLLKEGMVPNSASGVQKLLHQSPASSSWVLEPTGRYALLAVNGALAAKRRVLMAPPRKARAFLASLQSRAKTDRVDSRGLALFALSRLPGAGLPDYPVKTEAVERVDQLLKTRRGLVDARTALRQRLPELPFGKEILEAAVDGLEVQIEALDQQLAAATTETLAPEIKRLLQIPGVGPVTATAAASRLKARRFETADKFIAYIGLDVDIIQSGTRRGQNGLTRQGDAELRRLFYLCAQATVMHKNSPFRARYLQEKERGRKHTAAVCIVARKIARTCWSLLAHDEDYKPDRLFQQPDEQKKSGESDPAVDTEP